MKYFDKMFDKLVKEMRESAKRTEKTAFEEEEEVGIKEKFFNFYNEEEGYAVITQNKKHLHYIDGDEDCDIVACPQKNIFKFKIGSLEKTYSDFNEFEKFFEKMYGFLI